MKGRIFALAVLAFIISPLLIFAQDSTTAGGVSGIVSKIPEWVPIVITGLYEILARVIPTSKNWSILTFVMKVVSFVFPNTSTDSFKVTNLTTGNTVTTNKITVVKA